VPSELRPPSPSAAFREGLVAFEPALLALNSLRLARQPRGSGRPLFVLPGFGAGDISTIPLRSYLRSLGHDARGWGLGQNTGEVATMVRIMLDKVDHAVSLHGGPIPLVGWSLGGVIAREVARERPDHIEQVITFGSPVVGGPKYTRVGERYRARGADLDAIERAVAERNRRLITVPITAIFTKGDGVVSWKACIDAISPNVEHVEVHTTHLGLGIHHEVFVIVAQRLQRHHAPRVSPG
jgi:pimeloyl-ACP methyl ester carboxylesterase